MGLIQDGAIVSYLWGKKRWTAMIHEKGVKIVLLLLAHAAGSTNVTVAAVYIEKTHLKCIWNVLPNQSLYNVAKLSFQFQERRCQRRDIWGCGCFSYHHRKSYLSTGMRLP